MKRLQELDYDTVVFGHGPPGTKAAVDRQIEYYTDLRTAVRSAFYRGASEEDAVRQIRLPKYKDWRGYDDWLKLNVRGVYRWVASQGGAERGIRP